MRPGPHPFTLRHLQYAVAVADTLSFRRAAAYCNISQPSLSAQVAGLEAMIGVRLFERDRKRVLLTPAGKVFLDRARQILLEADDLASAAKRVHDPLKGTIRLGVIPTIAPYLLPFATPRIQRSFPQLTIEWTEDKTEAIVRSLETGALDGALLALEADIGNLEREVIAEDPFFLVAPRDHAVMATLAPARTRELRNASVLLLDEGHCFRHQVLELCSTARAREQEFRATSLPTLIQMVAQGAGVTLLPALAVGAETGRTALGVRPFDSPPPHRTIAIVWRRRSPLGPALRQLGNSIRDAYTQATSERLSGDSPKRRPARIKNKRKSKK